LGKKKREKPLDEGRVGGALFSVLQVLGGWCEGVLRGGNFYSEKREGRDHIGKISFRSLCILYKFKRLTLLFEG